MGPRDTARRIAQKLPQFFGFVPTSSPIYCATLQMSLDTLQTSWMLFAPVNQCRKSTNSKIFYSIKDALAAKSYTRNILPSTPARE
jgi:hypothetical protein